MIKETTKIISQKNNDSGGIDFILENGTWLGEVLDFLPNGIINKGVTGIGATTLEIKSPRNSIIVQPLKVTVEQKSQVTEELFAYNKKNLKNLNKELREYLSNKTYTYKKIILVIDKLSDLIFALGNDLATFFFLFDEIDYMQGSSTYRKNMAIGLDLGIALNNFALVSATHIGFSDPELQAQNIYNFKYEHEDYKSVQLYYFSSGYFTKSNKEKATLNQLYSCICHMLSTSESKLMVAINNVKLISEIADTLVKSSIIEKSNISLLISENSHRNDLLIKKFSGKKIDNSNLPTRLNFISSAYFNGYDLLEKDLCLIIYSSPNFKSNLISTNEMKQIYGRNRLLNGTSHFFVFTHDIRRHQLIDAEFLDYEAKDWYNLGKRSVEMQNCIDKHLKKLLLSNKENSFFANRFKEQVLSLELNLSRQKILFSKENFLEDFFNPFSQKTINEISYLQIDHKRYYYDYLNAIYVMQEFVIEDIVENEPSTLKYVSGVEEMFEDALLRVGFRLNHDKITWQKQVFMKATKTHRETIRETLEEMEFALKNIAETELNFDGLHKKLHEITINGKGKFSNKSVRKTILSCRSLEEIETLRGYLSYENFKKTKEHLFIKANLNIHQSYSLDELYKLISALYDRGHKKDYKINTKTKKEILRLVRLVYELKLVHKPGSKTGEKVYNLFKQTLFSSLVPVKKKKRA